MAVFASDPKMKIKSLNPCPMVSEFYNLYIKNRKVLTQLLYNKLIFNDCKSAEKNNMILYMFTMLPCWPHTRSLTPKPGVINFAICV